MQEIHHYLVFVFRLLFVPQGAIFWLLITALYSLCVIFINKGKLRIPDYIKILAYPFLVTYGSFMMVIANILEKPVIVNIGLFIALIPGIISSLRFITKEKEQQTD